MKSEITNKNTIAKPLDRKSPRARWHDYSGGEYFVTVCTKNRQHYFGEVSSGNNVVLTPIGSYLKMQIENLPQHYPYASVFTYIIMPNHIHLIIKIDANKTPYDRRDVARRIPTIDMTAKNEYMRDIANKQGWLSVCIGGMKSAVTRFANANQIDFGWQDSYHDHIIRDINEMNYIAGYIVLNPVRWENDKFYKSPTE
ncbi:MAG: transposase [Bacteroidales bacterium]|nr:transposase [Bacteroidales bacterium]